MKTYIVSRITIFSPYKSLDELKTCSKDFGTLDEALQCIAYVKKRFPKAFVSASGALARHITFTKRIATEGVGSIAVIRNGSVFWIVTERGDGLPMPVRLDKYLE